MVRIICSMVLLLTGMFAVVSIQDPEKPQEIQQDTTPFMEQKLDRSREVIEGLATEDYAQISKSAQRMMLLSMESDWKVVQGEQYALMSKEFRDSASRLRDAANNKNLDGATLAYFEVTLNCVRCHKYIRRWAAGQPKRQ